MEPTIANFFDRKLQRALAVEKMRGQYNLAGNRLDYDAKMYEVANNLMREKISQQSGNFRQKLQGEYGLQEQGMRGQSSMDVANIGAKANLGVAGIGANLEREQIASMEGIYNQLFESGQGGTGPTIPGFGQMTINPTQQQRQQPKYFQSLEDVTDKLFSEDKERAKKRSILDRYSMHGDFGGGF